MSTDEKESGMLSELDFFSSVRACMYACVCVCEFADVAIQCAMKIIFLNWFGSSTLS